MEETEFIVRTLGPSLEVFVRGQALRPLRSRKGEWLLALLAAQHGREVSREWLWERLWPEADAEDAARSLRQSVWDLRQALGSESWRIEARQPRTLRLNADSANVDVITFDRLAAQGDPSSLRQAAALYCGQFLDGCEEPWAITERQRRHQAFLSVLEALVALAQEDADYEAAITYWERWAVEDPLRDEPRRGLMRALADVGNPAGAVQVFHDFRRDLTRNDPLRRPAEPTARLYAQIRERLRAGSGGEPPPTISSQRSAPISPGEAQPAKPCRALPLISFEIVGREEEIKHVTDLARCRRLVTVTGGGGVGKSCLALAAAQHMAPAFPDGVGLIDFRLAMEPAEVVDVAADALGLVRQGSSPVLTTLIEALRPRRCLLLLDNCERHHGAACRLADAVLAYCPDVHVLAASRRALGLRDEHTYHVPLPVWNEVRQRLLDATFDPNAVMDADGATLLLDATFWGREGVARFLIERGADLNCVHRSGFTPLLNVIKFGHPHLAPMLLEAGARVNVRTPRGETPMGLAAERGLLQTVRDLLAAGGDPRVADNQGRTPAMLAEAAGYAEVASLLKAGAAQADAKLLRSAKLLPFLAR